MMTTNSKILLCRFIIVFLLWAGALPWLHKWFDVASSEYLIISIIYFMAVLWLSKIVTERIAGRMNRKK
jgi:hypothetical protein